MKNRVTYSEAADARKPRIRVAKAVLRSGGYFLIHTRGGTPKKRWWELTLACGHIEDRGVRYGGGYGRGWQIAHKLPPITAVKPAINRAQCSSCPRIVTAVSVG